ncbi:hypothetical protein AB0M86_29255 [Streptomyces sp. NPDC051639]|uniref:hypothetical protein n=1 Tax=Streptomyces sp. NPDC051639 TaxID=3155671 RepID=UPI0034283B03
MGNFGGSLVARSTAELRGLMEVAGFTGVDRTKLLAGGWQVADFADAPRHGLVALVQESGAPAVMKFPRDLGHSISMP